MKKCCEFLREHAMKIINFKKKKMQLLTKEQQESYENVKVCYICYIYLYLELQCFLELEIIVSVQGDIEVLHIAYVIWNIVYLKMFLSFFVMDQTMIIILS